MRTTILIFLLIQIPLLGVAQHLELPLWGENIPNYQETDEEEIRAWLGTH